MEYSDINESIKKTINETINTVSTSCKADMHAALSINITAGAVSDEVAKVRNQNINACKTTCKGLLVLPLQRSLDLCDDTCFDLYATVIDGISQSVNMSAFLSCPIDQNFTANLQSNLEEKVSAVLNLKTSSNISVTNKTSVITSVKNIFQTETLRKLQVGLVAFQSVNINDKGDTVDVKNITQKAQIVAIGTLLDNDVSYKTALKAIASEEQQLRQQPQMQPVQTIKPPVPTITTHRSTANIKDQQTTKSLLETIIDAITTIYVLDSSASDFNIKISIIICLVCCCLLICLSSLLVFMM